MTTNFDAIYENGAFRLLSESTLPLADGTQVRLTVESISKESKLNILDLGAQVYAGLSESDIAEVEKIELSSHQEKSEHGVSIRELFVQES